MAKGPELPNQPLLRWVARTGWYEVCRRSHATRCVPLRGFTGIFLITLPLASATANHALGATSCFSASKASQPGKGTF